MLSKRIFRFFPILLFTVCCQKTDNVISIKETDTSIVTINDHYNLSKDKSKDSIQRLNHVTKAYHLANKFQIDTLILKTLKRKTRLHSANKQLDSAIYFSYKMLQLSEKLSDTLSIGQSYYKLGVYYYEKEERDSSYQYYDRAKAIFLNLNDSTQAGKTLLNTAIILSDIGDYFGSDETAVEALKYLKSPEDDTEIASTYNCLAISSKKREDYEEALRWYKSAMNITNSEKNKITYLNNIANVFRDQEKYENAITIYDSIINDPLIENDLETKARILDNLTYSQWRMTERSTNDLENKFVEALNIRLQQDDLYGQIASNAHLSEYFERSDTERSIHYANAMYSVATQLNSIDDKLDALKKLFQLSNDPIYSALYMSLKDSITIIRNQHKNRFAKIRFGIERYIRNNLVLETQKAQDQLEIEKLSNQNTVYLLTLLLFIFSSIFISYQIRAKHKREKLQKIYETETRLAKKLHDEVANDVYNIMSGLQKKPKADNETINKLDVVYAKVRDISRENNDIDFDEDFEATLDGLLLNYKNDQVHIITRGISKTNWNKVARSKRIAIYRALQELLVNMKKHSNATHILVSFKNIKNKIVIHYSDNGVGYDLKNNSKPQNVENRIKAIHGTIIFESEKNKGFKAKITI